MNTNWTNYYLEIRANSFNSWLFFGDLATDYERLKHIILESNSHY